MDYETAKAKPSNSLLLWLNTNIHWLGIEILTAVTHAGTVAPKDLVSGPEAGR